MNTMVRFLSGFDDCAPFVKWALDADNASKTSAQLWEACNRGDWMVSVAGRLDMPKGYIALAACDCVRLAFPFTLPDDYRLHICVETSELLLWDEGSRVDVAKAAFNAAFAAAESAELADNPAVILFGGVRTMYLATNAAADAAVSVARATLDAHGASAPKLDSVNYSEQAVTQAAKALSFYHLRFADEGHSAMMLALEQCADEVRRRIPWSALGETSFPTLGETSFPTLGETSFPTLGETSFPTLGETSFPTLEESTGE